MSQNTKKKANNAPVYNGKIYDFCSKKKMILIIALAVGFIIAIIASLLTFALLY